MRVENNTITSNAKQWLATRRRWRCFRGGGGGGSCGGVWGRTWAEGFASLGRQRRDKALDCFFITLYTRTIYSVRGGGSSLPTGTPSLRGILCSASVGVWVCVCVYVELSRVCTLTVGWERSVAKDRFIAKNGENQSSDFCITRRNCRNARARVRVCMCVCVCIRVEGRSETKNGKKKKKNSNKQ